MDLPPKIEVARALLTEGPVFVHLDPRRPGVRVPSWLAEQPQLVLQIGLDMPIPIPDLRVDDAGISATLSFQRQPVPCHCPWDAIFALSGDDGRGMVWPDAIPSEIRAEVDKAAAGADVPPEPRVPEHSTDEDGVIHVAFGGPRGERAADTEDAADPEPTPAEDDELALAADIASTSPGEALAPVVVAKEKLLGPTELSAAPAPIQQEDAAGHDEVPAERGDDETDPDDEPPRSKTLPPYLRVVK